MRSGYVERAHLVAISLTRIIGEDQR